MRRDLLAVSVIGIVLFAFAAPCLAAYGAFALDDEGRKYGYSWNKESEREAGEAALKACGTEKCKVVFRTGPKECGAVAVATDSKMWGGARRNKQQQAAEFAAMQNCRQRTSGQCKVRASACNR